MAKTGPTPITTPAAAGLLLASKLKASARRPGIFGYKPHPKQILFHASPAIGRLFIGGNRSGKTVGGCTEDVLWLLRKHPLRKIKCAPDEPCRGRIVAVDFLEGVDKIILPEIAKLIPPSKLIQGSWERSYDRYNHTLTLEDGSFLEFMSYEQDVEKFAGTSRHFCHFDEEPPREIWQECLARLIDTGGHWWMTMTPLLGMTWVYEEIYVKAAYDARFFSIEVDMDDNPHIGEEEKEAFLSTLTVEEREARKQGRFVALGGKIYANFSGKNVIDACIPSKSTLWLGMMDHGLNNPTAWLWGSVDRDGSIIIFDEHYESGKIVGYHARIVLEKQAGYGKIFDYSVGDPSIVARNAVTGTSVQLEYYDYGVPIIPGNNDVKAGINRVKRYFGQEKLEVDGAVKQEEILPRLYITRNCVNLIHEIYRYRWATWATKRMSADRNKKDEPHKKDDHAVDALRYGVASRPEADTGDYLPTPVEMAGRMKEAGVKFSTAISSTGYVDPGVRHLVTSENLESGGYSDSYLGQDW